MKKITWIIGTAGLLVIGSHLHAATGRAKIAATSSGVPVDGTITFTDTKDGLAVSAEFKTAPAGNHGFHIHEFGSCDDLGKAAGGHYNPEGAPHGHITTDGMMKAHAGDLGNIVIAADGTGKLNAVIPGLTLSDGKKNVGGRAVILHEKADDFGQPVGNAGGRIGCGTIVLTGK